MERAITITAAPTETYDSWAQQTFGADYATHGSPDQDADGDGQSNHAEWLAKTDPLSAADKFKVATTTRDANGFKLRWLARTGVNYRVTWSNDLTCWTELPNTRVTGTGAEVERTDVSATGSRKF